MTFKVLCYVKVTYGWPVMEILYPWANKRIFVGRGDWKWIWYCKSTKVTKTQSYKNILNPRHGDKNYPLSCILNARTLAIETYNLAKIALKVCQRLKY